MKDLYIMNWEKFIEENWTLNVSPWANRWKLTEQDENLFHLERMRINKL
jgi:hypothetical protein